jgi:4-hydroxybenzoate polyprenyltransferase
MRQKLMALLQLGRVSNLPTIWTNCIAAWLLAGAGFTAVDSIWFKEFEPLIGWLGRSMRIPMIVVLMLAASLLYVGGTALNDAFDAKFDRLHRKDRPIPAGIFSAYMVWVIGLACLATGAFSFLLNAESSGDSPHVILIIGLVAVILLYDWIHKKTVWASLPMGGCRLLLYLVVAMGASHETLEPQQLISVLVFGSSLFIYIVTLTLAARAESGNETLKVSRRASWLLYLPAIASVIVQAMGDASAPQLLTGLLVSVFFILWIMKAIQLLHDDSAGKERIGKVVSRLLAAICLIDAMAAASASFVPALVCAGFFFCALWLQKYIPGT